MLCTLREGIRLLSFRKRRMLKSTADVTAVLSEVEKKHPASAHKHEGARVVHDETRERSIPS